MRNIFRDMGEKVEGTYPYNTSSWRRGIDVKKVIIKIKTMIKNILSSGQIE